MNRIVWVDWLRVTAIFMVLVVHATEPFYLGGEGTRVLTASDAFWVSLFDTLARACVPLFVIASSYLQFPLHYGTGEFFRRRALRVLVPFAFWTAIYAFVWGEPAQNFRDLLLNFNYAAGHLWFVYMLIGIYLLMPLLSPWAERVSKKELLVYLCICLVTTVIPFIREWAGGAAPVMYGPSGIPNPAKFPLWGECSWNSYGLFYYFSGFIGYILFGLYVRRFVGALSWGRTLAIALPTFLAGFAICFGGFMSRIWADAGAGFPIEGPVGIAALWELPLINDTTGVALMAVSWIFLFRKIHSDGPFYRRVMLPLSGASYGVYLCHMLILAPVALWLRTILGEGVGSSLGIWTTPVEILSTAILAFALSSIACIVIRRIPKIGQYIAG